MNAAQAILNKPWCITQDWLTTILAIARRENPSIAALEAQLGRKLEYTRAVTERGGVATIPIDGPICRKANLFSAMSGATSLEVLAKDFHTALHNPQVRSIVFHIDSPGGEATGIHEFAQIVHQARGQKPIVAYVEGIGASAAYWIASACDTVVCDATAMLGSIGVVAAMDGSDDPDEIVFVSAQSPNKRPDLKTDEGRASVQALIDRTADVFIADVARNRGVTAEQVVSRFGAGGLKVGADAVEAGLADRLGSYEDELARLQGRAQTAPGGALRADTDVPALQSLASLPAVTAAAMPLRMPAPPARKQIDAPHKESRMSDDTVRAPETEPTALDTELSAAEQARIDRIVAMRTAEAREAEARVLAAAEARFERLMAEERTRTQVESYAQHITTPTLTRQHALPGQASAYSAFMLSLSTDQRKAATGIFDTILASGLVSFEEIGTGGEGAETRDAAARWETAVSAKVALGMPRSAAITALMDQQPDLYQAYRAASDTTKKGRR